MALGSLEDLSFVVTNEGNPPRATLAQQALTRLTTPASPSGSSPCPARSSLIARLTPIPFNGT